MTDSHNTTPTRYVEIDGDRFAYRRWGNTSSGQPPLLFLQHFRGGLDHWDPVMTDGLAAGPAAHAHSARARAQKSGIARMRSMTK